jgi:hypothetical protein
MLIIKITNPRGEETKHTRWSDALRHANLFSNKKESAKSATALFERNGYKVEAKFFGSLEPKKDNDGK